MIDDNEKIFNLAIKGLESMLRKFGPDHSFPPDAIWQYVPENDQIVPTKKPHQANSLVKDGYLLRTGETTKAESGPRAGSVTPLYRFGPLLVNGSATPPTAPIGVADPQNPWFKLAGFALDNGWTSHKPARVSFNVILEGVPGTGKTQALKQLANTMGNSDTIAAGPFATTMHPATSYEDFVEGLRPGVALPYQGRAELDAAAMTASVASATVQASGWFFEPVGTSSTSSTSSTSDFCLHDGFFVAACAAAVRNPNTPYVVLLDELNRCNIPKVMGDLITTMEVSKRAKWNAAINHWDLSSAQVVTLPYSKRQFFVPDNLTIVGTMNTTDRSVAPMDAALRRRFVFVRVEPKFPEFKDETPSFTAARSQVVELNKALKTYLGADAVLGHSYFYDMKREIDDGGDAAAVTRFYFDKVIFPMVVDTLVNNGCLAELYEASKSTQQRSSSGVEPTAAGFLAALQSVAKTDFSGRGSSQTLRLEWKAPSPNAAEIPTPKLSEGVDEEGPANDDVAVDSDV